MSAVGYVFVRDADVARVAKRVEPFAGPMARRPDGVYTSADNDVFVMPSIKPSRFDAEVHIYRGDTEAKQKDLTKQVFRLLREHGDVALEANYEREDELATFEPT